MDIDALSRLPVNERVEQTKALILSLLTASPPKVDNASTVIASVTGEDVPLSVSRQVLEFVGSYLPNLEHEVNKHLSNFLLERVSQRISFEEIQVLLLENLAMVHEKEEDWVGAAKLLARMPLESGSRTFPAAKRADVYVHIAQLYLQDRDSVTAEIFINRAAGPIADCPPHTALHLRYKVCYARILDSKRKFMEAAQLYCRISQSDRTTVDGQSVSEEELMTALSHSVTCAILSPAGPARSRLLAILYKDERSARLGHKYSVLKNMFLNRIISFKDIETFSQTLQPHQMATLSDNSTTVLDRAMLEHNLLSASKIYNNIYLRDLGALLQVSPEKAENVAGRMIMEGRMQGHIDQVQEILVFESEEMLQTWNGQIADVCQAASDAVDEAVSKYPQLIA
eukprot:c10965_g1_i1.p1 GENE.c10965_g1_i1~~c10965_g1_i1.p1  ORF type:complete len:405 (-),score=109.46 c10965_g1_i1:217-1410(-)